MSASSIASSPSPRRAELDDTEGAAALAAELGDLPLALAQAATVIKLRSRSYFEYLEELRSFPIEAALPRDRGDAYPHGVAAAILLSVDAAQQDDLSGLTERVLVAVALLAADGVDRDTLATVLVSSTKDRRSSMKRCRV